MTRHLIPWREFAAWRAMGFRLVFTMPGGMRFDGDLAVIERRRA